MELLESQVLPYQLPDDATLLTYKLADKCLNRGYTCKKDGETVHIYPSQFQMSPSTNGDKLLWGSPERIDGATNRSTGTCNVEDYSRYSPQSEMIDDNNIFLGNIKAETSPRRGAFYANGYQNEKFTTNVIPDAIVDAVSTGHGGFVSFTINGITDSGIKAVSLRFPNGYVCNCVKDSGYFQCYTMTDDHTRNVIARLLSNPQDEPAKSYLRRTSVFPSVSYSTFVSPFYSEMNMAYIDNSNVIDIEVSSKIVDYDINSGTSTATTAYSFEIVFAGMALQGENNKMNVVAIVGITDTAVTPSKIGNQLIISFLGGSYAMLKSADGDKWDPISINTTTDQTNWGNIGISNNYSSSINTELASTPLTQAITGLTLTGFTLNEDSSYVYVNSSEVVEITIKVNNKIGSDKYSDFKLEYYRSSTDRWADLSGVTFGVISGINTTATGYRTINSSMTKTFRVRLKNFKINGSSSYTYSNVKRKYNATTLYAVYGRVNGGLYHGDGSNRSHNIDNLNGITQPGSNYTGRVTVSLSTAKTILPSGSTSVTPLSISNTINSFYYELSEKPESLESWMTGLTFDNIISDEITFSVFPKLLYDGSHIFVDRPTECSFFFENNNGKYFKVDTVSACSMYNITTAQTAFNFTPPTSWGTEITSSIKSQTGYAPGDNFPLQTRFIVGVYTSYDPNDTGTGENRRVKSRLIKIYRNYEIEYIGD